MLGWGLAVPDDSAWSQAPEPQLDFEMDNLWAGALLQQVVCLLCIQLTQVWSLGPHYQFLALYIDTLPPLPSQPASTASTAEYCQVWHKSKNKKIISSF